MSKKLKKLGKELAVVIDKPVLKALGINQKTVLEVIVVDDVLIIRPKASKSKKNKTKKSHLLETAHRLMDKYEVVFEKLAKTGSV